MLSAAAAAGARLLAAVHALWAGAGAAATAAAQTPWAPAVLLLAAVGLGSLLGHVLGTYCYRPIPEVSALSAPGPGLQRLPCIGQAHCTLLSAAAGAAAEQRGESMLQTTGQGYTVYQKVYLEPFSGQDRNQMCDILRECVCPASQGQAPGTTRAARVSASPFGACAH